MPGNRWLATAVAVLLACAVCSEAAASAIAGTPKLALYDINGSAILSTTSEDEVTTFGWRSLLSSRFDPHPAVSVAKLTFTTPSHVSGSTSLDFLTVPYCERTAGDTAPCDLSDYLVHLLIRFRRHQEVNFEATVWQDASLTTTTQRALTAFKAKLNRTDVVFPAAGGAMRMEESAACVGLTDECYLAAAATYTRSYKEVDPAQYSGRFLFRLGEKYSHNTPWLMRLQHSLPHDAEAEVEVVVVLSPRPAANVVDPRWWVESVGGRFALLAVSIVVAFGFLVCTREVGTLMVRHRTTPVAGTPPSALYDDLDLSAFVAVLQRVARVSADAVQRVFDFVAARVRGLRCTGSCTTPWRRWSEQRRRLPTDDDAAGETGREIAAVTSSDTTATSTNNDGAAGANAVSAPAPAAAAASAADAEEEAGPMCRICRCREPFDDLFAPCACNGSSKYVHHHCLEQWREMTTNPEHRRVCAECKTPYTLVRVLVPQNPNLITSSPIIEPVVRHYVSTGMYVAVTIVFAVFGAYGLKAVFFLTTAFDMQIEWSLTQGYHWVLTAYFLAALWMNVHIMQPFVKDMDSAALQLLCVFASLALIEIPLSYGFSAFFSLFFDRLLTWEISYGLGLFCTFFMHIMDVFANFAEMLDSFAEEREMVAPRAATGEGEGEAERPPV